MEDSQLSIPKADLYEKAETILENMALGLSDGAHRTMSYTEDDGDGSIRTAVQEYGPDPELLLELLKGRIGGPQDWC